MIMKCMEKLLDEKNKKEFIRQVDNEIKQLSQKLKVISIDNVLKIMGFPVNNK